MYNEKDLFEENDAPLLGGNSAVITLDEIAGKFSETNWRVFEIIVSKGISEEKDAKRIVVDTMIEEDRECVSEDTQQADYCECVPGKQDQHGGSDFQSSDTNRDRPNGL